MGVPEDYLYGGFSDHPEARPIESWYRQITGGSVRGKKYSFIAGKTKGEITSAVLYSEATPYSIMMDVCAPRALTRNLIKQMWHYPFNQLKVKKVFGLIDARNTLSIRTFEKMGCKKETELKDYFGEGIHRLVYTATREDVKKWVTS